MEIKRKIMDFSFNSIHIALKYSLILFITNPLFYFFITKLKIIYLIVDIFFVLSVVIIFNFVFLITLYIRYKTENYNSKIEFYQDFLEVKYKKGIKKIYYSDVGIIIIRKNLLGSREILINYPTIYRSDNIFNNFRKDERNNIVLSYVLNYEEILSKLTEKIGFNQLEKNFIRLKYESKLISLLTIVYMIILFTIFYKIKYNFALLLLLLIKKHYNYTYIENCEGIKISGNDEVIYLKEENYIKKKNRLELKIKNSDSLMQKRVFKILKD